MERDTRIYVAGHRGLVGSAIVRRLQADGHTQLITRTHAELDLTDEHATRAFFDLHLKRDADAAKRLTVDGLKPLLRGEIDAVEVLAK